MGKMKMKSITIPELMDKDACLHFKTSSIW